MGRIIIEHLSGSKNGQTEYFETDKDFKEIIIGRDVTSNIKYDPDRDDLVGRQHAKITRDELDSNKFFVVDLNSRNGTFVNNQRINSKTILWSGDKIQFGVGGPEMVFKLDPPTSSASGDGIRATRVPNANNASNFISETRQVEIPNSTITEPRSVFGKRTVEIMLQQVRGEGHRNLLVFGVGVAVIIAVISGIFGYSVYQSRKNQENLVQKIENKIENDKINNDSQPLTANKIYDSFNNSVVYIEVSWKLIYTPTGDAVYQQCYRNIPAYIKVASGKIEPMLTLNGNCKDLIIGGNLRGSGFAVTADGYILTARHVVSAWKSNYEKLKPGILVVQDSDGTLKPVKQIDQQELESIQWIPEESEQVSGAFQIRDLTGRNDVLDVTFPKSTIRYRADYPIVSPRHDIAMIKIGFTEPITKLDLFDNYDTIKVGDTVNIIGYPSTVASTTATVESEDLLSRKEQKSVFPIPTLSNGNIASILRGDSVGGLLRGETADNSKKAVLVAAGNYYQLAATLTGPGVSGGPVFDNYGRVIGIVSLGGKNNNNIVLAVPIRFAQEIMRPQK
jgi:serine protease Do